MSDNPPKDSFIDGQPEDSTALALLETVFPGHVFLVHRVNEATGDVASFGNIDPEDTLALLDLVHKAMLTAPDRRTQS